MRIFYLLLFIAFFSCTSGTNNREWPDWRGKNRDAVWNESGVGEKFTSPVIEKKWSVPIGPGYSGPTVAHGKVYVADRPENATNTEVERILCFDVQTGTQIWEHEYACEYGRGLSCRATRLGGN